MEMDSRELARDMPWPFPDGCFPESLGAVVQRTVLSLIAAAVALP
jgi:hypothetical protein